MDYGYIVIATVGSLAVGFYIGIVSMYHFCKHHLKELEEEVALGEETGDDGEDE